MSNVQDDKFVFCHLLWKDGAWRFTWSGLCSRGQLSQWSPTPSLSVSLWSTLYTYGQLSSSFRIPVELKHACSSGPYCWKAEKVSCRLEKSLTVTINVNGAGVALSVIVGVSLVSVSLENTVVTAIANIISVCVILRRVVQPWTVVLDETSHKIRH